MVLMWCDSWHTYQVNETSSLTSRGGSLKVSLERLNVIKLLTIYSRTMDTHRSPTDSEQHTDTNKREKEVMTHIIPFSTISWNLTTTAYSFSGFTLTHTVTYKIPSFHNNESSIANSDLAM